MVWCQCSFVESSFTALQLPDKQLSLGVPPAYPCSALTFNVAGNLKMAVSIVFAALLFHAPMTQLSLAGCIVVLSGVGLYGWALYRVRRRKLEMSRTDSERSRLREEENVDVYLGAML